MVGNQRKLIKKAQNKYKKIFPCRDKKSFAECFTSYNNRLFFWFDTEDQSTHVEIEDNVEVK
jgi:hypothetical protein